MRYVVTELEGYLNGGRGGGANVGLSCHVIDTAWNQRLIATYRTEDYPSGGHQWARLAVRDRATRHAARMNADA